ncbi:MAG: hypothetical protein E4H14_09020 [Candidatus Thorarchaeota archaeon]|nr:MAG: hypothetical protein E4H14_09020 [Candidatus Thorarchaeota archaeon]
MNDESMIDELRVEIETLRNRVDQQTTYIGILSVFVIALIILTLLINTSGFVFLAVVAIMVLPIALGLRRLEQRGI